MVKDHSDSKRGNLLPLHGLLFPIKSNGHTKTGQNFSDVLNKISESPDN